MGACVWGSLEQDDPYTMTVHGCMCMGVPKQQDPYTMTVYGCMCMAVFGARRPLYNASLWVAVYRGLRLCTVAGVQVGVRDPYTVTSFICVISRGGGDPYP